MKNDLASFNWVAAAADVVPDAAVQNGTRPDLTLAITRGASRLLTDMGFALVPEFTLPNGRRADLAGLSRKGRIVIVEVKSCREDFTADAKWPSYLEYCDQFYFATDTRFPAGLLPEGEGRIVADAYGGAIIADAEVRTLAGSRRKAMTLSFARQAAFRLTV
ncbi:MmcB family DNA repair protein [Parvularcula flava]|nr:MmcB family DNA repair protein [Aquisalinus luteolus]NHK28284.1 MmcB family DNA repair protein [Aquisalinus luteolus]